MIDGTARRVPQTRVTTADGARMEMYPRPLGIAVDKPLGEGLAGKDSRLDAAVREFLRHIGGKGC